MPTEAPIDIAKLRALIAAASKRPWRPGVTRTCVVDADGQLVVPIVKITPQMDLELICAAVNALPELLDELEQLRNAIVTTNVTWKQTAERLRSKNTRLLAVFKAACAWRSDEESSFDVTRDLRDAVDAARKEGT